MPRSRVFWLVARRRTLSRLQTTHPPGHWRIGKAKSLLARVQVRVAALD